MRLRVRHETRYSFETPAQFGLQQVRKTPKSSPMQNLLSWDTQLIGGIHEVSFTDHHGNVVDLISFDSNAQDITLLSEGEVDIQSNDGVIGRHRGHCPLWLYQRASVLTHAGRGVKSLARSVKSDDTLAMMHALSAAIRDAVSYEIGASQADWTAETALTEGRGVCQDHTHVFLACARALGVPSRYVSGYLMLDNQITQDAMHAWAEAHIEGLGWVGFDISNGISPDARYVRVATGLDYTEAAPVIGTRVGGAHETLSVAIEVAQQ